MQIQITDTVTEDDQNALLTGLRAYNPGGIDWQNQRGMVEH